MTTSVLEPISLTPGRRASKAIKDAVRNTDSDGLQSLLIQHFQKPRQRLQKKNPVKGSLAFWSVDDLELNGRERELASAIENLPAVPRDGQKRHATKQREFRQRLKSLLTAWIDDANGDCGSWELLAIAELLLQFGEHFSSPLFVSTISFLAEHIPVIQESLQHAVGGPRLELLLKTEAGLLICEMLEPIQLRGCRSRAFVKATWEAWNHAVDEKGMWQSTIFEAVPAWTSSFVRCQLWCEAFGAKWMKADQTKRWTRCVRKLVCHLTCDGQCLSESGQESVASDRFLNVLQAATRVGGCSLTERFASLLNDCQRIRRSSRPLPTAHTVLPKKGYAKKSKIPSWQSDDASIAVIRTSTRPFADAATLSWTSDQIDVALAAAGVPCLRGRWSLNVLVDDVQVAGPNSWRASCWYRDPEVALVELTGLNCGNLTVIRQVMISLQEQYAVLTDSVTTESPSHKVTLQTSLETVRDTTAVPDDITNELMLSPHPRRHVRALPGWMEDDKLRASNGVFEYSENTLGSSTSGQGGVVLPLVLDWNEKRSNSVADWNRLTVCESGRQVGDHEAMAYRVRAGKLQLAIYRSLKTPGFPRSVLGMHTGDESLYAQIQSGEPPRCLVDIEAPEQQATEPVSSTGD